MNISLDRKMEVELQVQKILAFKNLIEPVKLSFECLYHFYSLQLCIPSCICIPSYPPLNLTLDIICLFNFCHINKGRNSESHGLICISLILVKSSIFRMFIGPYVYFCIFLILLLAPLFCMGICIFLIDF